MTTTTDTEPDTHPDTVPAPGPAVPEGVQESAQVQEPRKAWTSGKRWTWAERLGFYSPAPAGIKSTTRQCEATYLAVASAPTSSRGFIFGVDAFSDWPFYTDPFVAYEDKELSSPNVIRIGDLGKGKSSGMTTGSITRPLLFGRRSVVIDKKLDAETGEGEYAHKARSLGVEPIRFALDGTGVTVNLLDPAIGVDEHPGGRAEGRKPVGQAALLRAVVTEALGRDLSAREGKALAMAHHAALATATAEGRVAVVRDVVKALLLPDRGAAEAAHLGVGELREWGLDPAFALERLLDDDLAGIVDGETSPNVKLGNGLTVFDVSALPEDGPALGIVMLIISTWLFNTLYTQKRVHGSVVPTHLVVEEAWHLVRGAFALVIQRLTKLSRALSLSCDFAFHHVSDIPAGSPAAAMMKEAGSKYFYGQDNHDEAAATTVMFNLPAGTEDVLMGLDQGVCLVKIGSKDANLVTHLRSDYETDITNTDKAMLASGTLTLTT